MSYMPQSAFGKTDTMPNMKKCEEYTMICIYYLVWGAVLEISDEVVKKIQRKEILSGNLQLWVEKMGFDNGRQYNNT